MNDLIKRSDAIKAIWGEDINPSDDGLVFEAQSHIDRDIRLIPPADRKKTMGDELIRRSDAIGACAYETIECYEARKAIRALPSADRPQETCLKEAEILLKATRNLLNKQNKSIYVLNMLEETVAYYGVECDGSCLIEDIDAWLDLYGSEEGADDE